MKNLWTRLPIIFACILLVGVMPLFAQDVKGEKYTVKSGDTLLNIAIQFDTSAECIRQANDLKDYGAIPSDVKELVIPDDCSLVLGQGGGALADITYTVQHGDYLNKIADAFGVTTTCLIQANHIANMNLIYPGQELAITASCQGSGGGGAVESVSSTSSAAVCQYDRNPGRTAADGKYTVQVGDSLDFIACDFGISLECLTSANPQLDNRGRLTIGDTLNIDLSCPAWTAWPGAGQQ